jgi:hypothetical protein
MAGVAQSESERAAVGDDYLRQAGLCRSLKDEAARARALAASDGAYQNVEMTPERRSLRAWHLKRAGEPQRAAEVCPEAEKAGALWQQYQAATDSQKKQSLLNQYGEAAVAARQGELAIERFVAAKATGQQCLRFAQASFDVGDRIHAELSLAAIPETEIAKDTELRDQVRWLREKLVEAAPDGTLRVARELDKRGDVFDRAATQSRQAGNTATAETLAASANNCRARARELRATVLR